MPFDSLSITDTLRTHPKKRLNDRLVRSLAPPAKGNRITYDADLKGFGLRVTAAGARAFVLNYRIKGRERRMTIGSYPDWTVLAARREAESLKRLVDRGDDPLLFRERERHAPTVKDLFAKYQSEHLPNKAPRAAADDRSMWQKLILPAMGTTKVADITSYDCDRLHRDISKDRPIRANRVLEVLRKGFDLALRWGWIDRNPASGFRRNPENKRSRYLDETEIERLFDALSKHGEETSCDVIRFLLLTGCRKGEGLKARWDQFDLNAGIWTKQSNETKQRKLHRVPLSKATIQLLRNRQATIKGDFVFPGKHDRPLTDIKRTWLAVRSIAGLEDVRIHDLRHTYASVLASQGLSLPVIGALLGHTQAQTTLRYAHLIDDTLRAATEVVADNLSKSQRVEKTLCGA
ncbi:MAG: site-specific integrase [Pseudomonadota bacterium]